MEYNLIKDSMAIVLLCSDLALDPSVNPIKPYTIKQWSKLADTLMTSALKSPAAFLDTTQDDWQKELHLSHEECSRIQGLLSRAAQVTIELEKLSGMGIYALTRAEKNYPRQLKERLKKDSPPVLYYSGNLDILQSQGVAVVGSRNIDEKGAEFTQKLGKKCAEEGFFVVSGGAEGVDTIAETSALKSNGLAVSIVSNSMIGRIKQKETREAIADGKLLLLSTFHPKSSFTVYNAMDRNKYIYALSHYAVVVSSDYKKGGTYAGAAENLKRQMVPLFVRRDKDISHGSFSLINDGGIGLPADELEKAEFKLGAFFEERTRTPSSPMS